MLPLDGRSSAEGQSCLTERHEDVGPKVHLNHWNRWNRHEAGKWLEICTEIYIYIYIHTYMYIICIYINLYYIYIYMCGQNW